MQRRCFILGAVLLLVVASSVFGQANGKLQIHFMDVGQGDGAVLISPLGEVVLFDDGVKNSCHLPLSYLDQLGVTKVDYHIASHYHDDHIGCAQEILQLFPLQKDAIDRGGTYNSSAFQRYLAAVGTHRKVATPGTKILLDSGTSEPVSIEIVALNGDGIPTTNENDLSVVAVVHYGQFDAEMGGDLSGYQSGSYKDIETSVAPKVGQIEVYKVHHHCSRYSSNDTWLSMTRPMVAIISASGTIGRNYGHPTIECLERLHNAGVRKTYWTEVGGGAEPEPGLDVVGGNIDVEVSPGSNTFIVKYGGGTLVDTHPVWEDGQTPAGETAKYAWSKKSKYYHYANCSYVANITAQNLERGPSPPSGKELHKGCPR